VVVLDVDRRAPSAVSMQATVWDLEIREPVGPPLDPREGRVLWSLDWRPDGHQLIGERCTGVELHQRRRTDARHHQHGRAW
jgi:hypothetical protein